MERWTVTHRTATLAEHEQALFRLGGRYLGPLLGAALERAQKATMVRTPVGYVLNAKLVSEDGLPNGLGRDHGPQLFLALDDPLLVTLATLALHVGYLNSIRHKVLVIHRHAPCDRLAPPPSSGAVRVAKLQMGIRK